MRVLFGLDERPIWQQYLSYWQSIFTGDMGVSISRFPTPVTEVIASQIGWTLLLGGTALIIAVVVGNSLGILAAWRRGGVLDSILPPVLVFIGSFPYFWLAMGALYLFGVTLGWFPLRHAYSAGMTPSWSPEFIADVAAHLVLPVTTIVLVSIGGWMLGMRNTMIATNSEDYIVMAEAKGLRPSRVMLRYAARNATLPAVTIVRHGHRVRRRRRPAHRGRLRLPRPGLPAPRGRHRPGLPADAGHLPDHHGRRPGRELPRRHRLRPPRPARAGLLNRKEDHSCLPPTPPRCSCSLATDHREILSGPTAPAALDRPPTTARVRQGLVHSLRRATARR